MGDNHTRDDRNDKPRYGDAAKSRPNAEPTEHGQRGHDCVPRPRVDVLRRTVDSAVDDAGVDERAERVAQALARIPAVSPDVAVLDVRLPDGNGIELCRELLSRVDGLRCLMLTSLTDDEAMMDAILAGASGYVIKDITGLELARAIAEVGAGRSLLDNRAAAVLADSRAASQPGERLLVRRASKIAQALWQRPERALLPAAHARLAQARAHRDAARKLLADDGDGFQMMKQARSPRPTLQRTIDARSQRFDRAVTPTPGGVTHGQRAPAAAISEANVP